MAESPGETVMMIKVPAVVGKRIRKGRRARGMTQTEFAACCGLSRRHLAAIESGANFSVSALLMIEAALGPVLPRRRKRDPRELFAEALSLPKAKRAQLAGGILASLQGPADPDWEAAWAAEIERRCAAVDAGEVQTSDWNEFRARIEREIFGR